LGLIVVDEEHDPSYKQSDPAPRYQGRDTALYLSKLTGANVILGSATPSMETYHNGINGKLGVVNLIHRFGEAVLPDIEIVDLKQMHKDGQMRSMFSVPLLEAMKEALRQNEQIILFQNRRGYSPTLQCSVCEWVAECPNCDVTLTTHKYYDQLRCHYCGYRHTTPKECHACGSNKLIKVGFGTEKIEDELAKFLKDANIARLDYDTAKTRAQFESLIYDFEHHEIDVLIGTQMITKGLDFDNIGLVGILLADKIMNFPDFRANERAFQLFTQVAGRAGRRKKKGKVIIQTYNPTHAVIQETLKVDYAGYYKRELAERQEFKYPPYFRQMTLTIKHKMQDKCNQTAEFLAIKLREALGGRVVGPAAPGIPRIRNQYITLITIKMEQDWEAIKKIKDIVQNAVSHLKSQKNTSTVRININIDP
jgi:primosomal protein N' (replication factor Y)